MQNIDRKQLAGLIKAFNGTPVTVFGDIMIDHFIRGKVSRISPEAPVPVVLVKEETLLPGGAGNVASNLAALGAKVSLVSVVGDDAAADSLLESIQANGVDVSGVLRDKQRPTTEKVRVIAEHQQVVRFDREASHSLSAPVCAGCINNLKKALASSKGVVLSDYGKGVLCDATIKASIEACRAARIPVTVDPKVEHFKKYRQVTCITPNTKEAWEGMRLMPKDGQPAIEDLGKNIMATLDSTTVLITQGPNGMTLFEKDCISHTPTVAREVYDVTGAGDTVISVFTLALAAGANYKQAALISNYAAGIVVGKLGTATVSREELLESLK